MRAGHRLTRRATLAGTAGAAAAGIAGRPGILAAQQATPGATPMATPVAGPSEVPLWEIAAEQGIVYGTSLATWQASDEEYLPLVDHHAALLFTEDDLLWYRVKTGPDAPLDFTYSDQFMAMALQQNQLVLGAHLVWDEGFGEGWTEDDLWGMDEATARATLFDTVEATLRRYQGQMAGWIVVNEVVDAHEADGLRTDYLWMETIGPSVIADAFNLAHEIDPDALLLINEFGFETDSEFDAAADRRNNMLLVLDSLLEQDVPVQALGVQAHLDAADFAERFDADAYTDFLAEVASRGLQILITEMDVLDDNVPADPEVRDQVIADAYGRYLDVALAEPEVGAVITFGLTDRYTWLQEDYPREDGAPRRPLLFDENLQAKPAYDAVATALGNAPERELMWELPRES